MLLTLYPNNELRARITAPPVARRRQVGQRRWRAESPSLTIVEKLRSEIPSCFFKKKKLGVDRPGYGASPRGVKFSVRARRQIARCGGTLGTLGGRTATLFLTGTLPGSTDESKKALSDWSSWIVHELLTCLPRLAGLRPSEVRTIWVWELQKRGALHWHCAIESPTRALAHKIHRGFKSVWIRVLETVGRKAGVDIARKNDEITHSGNYTVWQSVSQWARKNPARYLAKYLGKEKGNQAGQTYYPPTRWYGVSRSLLRESLKATLNATTATTPGTKDFVVQEGVDLEVLEKLFRVSTTVRHFPDKVKSGYTFVFYLSEENRKIGEQIMSEFTPKQSAPTVESVQKRRAKSYALVAIASYPRLLDRFLLCVGDHSRPFYCSWSSGEEIPDDELFWLNQCAHSVFLFEGWGYQGQPPERSGAGLPGQELPKIGTSEPPLLELEQSSLLP